MPGRPKWEYSDLLLKNADFAQFVVVRGGIYWVDDLPQPKGRDYVASLKATTGKKDDRDYLFS